MKAISLSLTLTLLAASSTMFAQTSARTTERPMLSASTAGVTRIEPRSTIDDFTPFSHMAFGGGISPLGINLQAAVNVNRHINVRGEGNIFRHDLNNISTNGLNINGKLNFATAGVSVDYYPFPNHGFRLSPGALFYNDTTVAGDITVAGGTKFSLNDVDYYASSSDPIKGNGGIGLNARNPAFAITTGWGNMIPRSGSHWSFPFEIGAAFTGAPTLNMALTSGEACDSNGLNCVNVASDPTVQANLQAQLTKYRNDLNPYQFYPIVSFGASYSFRIRK